MNKSILICRSNPISPDPRVEKIAQSLSSGGYQVTALGWDRMGNLPVEEQKGQISIRRLSIRASFGNGMGNLPQLLRWQWGLMIWLAREHRHFEILHACDFDTILPALFCKLLWHKPVVYDIFDFYADHLRKTPKFIKTLIRRLDFQAIRFSDAVILVDESRRQQISGSHPKKLEIIYNSPEDVGAEIKLEPTLSPGNPVLRLAYIGLLQVERGLIEILHVLAHYPDWHLDLAGFGGDEKEILMLANQMPNVTWHGRIIYQRALELSAQADVLFATYDPQIPNHRYSSPNKVFEAMMLGKPVVVARHTNMDSIIEEAGCGVVVDYGDETALAIALEQLASDPLLRSRLGANARRAYAEKYSWKIMEARLLALYQGLQASQ
jgi:glycosyltransferase involved in cell wall biosynthesis